MIGILFGPWVGGVAAALSDILGFIIGGGVGGFFPGFTLSAFLSGLAYGVFLHKKKVTKKRVFMAVAFNTLFVNLTLNTLWLYILTQNPIAVILPPRLVQNAHHVRCPLLEHLVYREQQAAAKSLYEILDSQDLKNILFKVTR
ncbi:MAG: folate family ECF transporter S component [Alkalibacterium sp.]|nr:folate family ECF transporter S component [Alkalibacterium sp.]